MDYIQLTPKPDEPGVYNIINSRELLALIDITDKSTLSAIYNELNNNPSINYAQKNTLINYLRDRMAALSNMTEEENYNNTTNRNTTTLSPGKQLTLLKNGTSQHPNHSQLPSSTPYDPENRGRSILGDKAALISEALLLAGIGATVVMYALLVYANIIK